MKYKIYLNKELSEYLNSCARIERVSSNSLLKVLVVEFLYAGMLHSNLIIKDKIKRK